MLDEMNVGISGDAKILMNDNSFALLSDIECGCRVQTLSITPTSSLVSPSFLANIHLMETSIQGLSHFDTPLTYQFIRLNHNLVLGSDQQLLLKVSGGYRYVSCAKLKPEDQVKGSQGDTRITAVHFCEKPQLTVRIKPRAELIILKLGSSDVMVRANRMLQWKGVKCSRKLPYHFTVDMVQKFWSSFSGHGDWPSDVRILTSQTGVEPGQKTLLYCRKEPDNTETAIGAHTNILLTCIDDEEHQMTYDRRIFVTFAALSFFSRKHACPEDLLKPLIELNSISKTRMCDSLIFNKPGSWTYNAQRLESPNGLPRDEFGKLLKELLPIEHPPHNWKRWSSLQFDDAVEIHRPYQFSLAFENDDRPGWVTEKIINAFLAGCIPIYRGTSDVTDYFNPNAFIDARNFTSIKQLANYVKDVHASPTLMRNYLAQPPCNPYNLQKLFYWLY
jgi:hypothetical protein